MCQKSIAFLIPKFDPEKCGVTDYCIRMAVLCGKKGIKTAVLAIENVVDDQTFHTTEGHTTLRNLTNNTASEYEVIVVQYVPNFDVISLRFYHVLTNLKHKNVHFMIHECWYFPFENYNLNSKSKLKSLLQKTLLIYLVLTVRPSKFTTSNPYYQNLLRKVRIKAELSPMLGNIPIGEGAHTPKNLNLPDWWPGKSNPFVWVSFGRLHMGEWHSEAHFSEARAHMNSNDVNFYWVFCGNMNSKDKKSLTLAASMFGFENSIYFTDMLEPEGVDWWLRHCDAGLSGNPPELWEKSTGILAILERGKPVLLLRPDKSRKQEFSKLFYSIEKIMIAHINNEYDTSLMKSEREPFTLIENFINVNL